MKTMCRFRVWMLLVLYLLLLAGCGQTEKTAVQTAPEKLKIGILPVEDILPSVVAVENGYFTQENIDVELVRFQSAVEQGSAMQSGQLDGMITDLVVSALLKDSGQNIKVTSITLGSAPEEGKFAIVAAPKSGIETLDKKKGAVEAFYRAYAKAVDDLNNQPADYKQLMIENVNIPEPIAKDYQIQHYPKPQLPTEEDINNILEWMTKRGLLKTNLKYQDLVEKI